MGKINKMTNHALVLGGGGSYAIGWELGYLSALAEEGIEVRQLDLVIGTSGGAQAAAAITSNQNWEEIFQQQIVPKSDEEPPHQDMGTIIAKYNEIAKKSTNSKDWLKNYSLFALENNKFDESIHLNRLKKRILVKEWPDNLMITAIDAKKSERVVFTAESKVEIHKAMSSSGSLPGVWPATTIGDRKYYDGGCHSMDNADLAIGAKKVLILSPNLPVVTPYTLDEAMKNLEENGSEVKLITPSQEVVDKLFELGGNTVDTKIRPEIAKIAKEQGKKEAAVIREFFKA